MFLVRTWSLLENIYKVLIILSLHKIQAILLLTDYFQLGFSVVCVEFGALSRDLTFDCFHRPQADILYVHVPSRTFHFVHFERFPLEDDDGFLAPRGPPVELMRPPIPVRYLVLNTVLYVMSICYELYVIYELCYNMCIMYCLTGLLHNTQPNAYNMRFFTGKLTSTKHVIHK